MKCKNIAKILVATILMGFFSVYPSTTKAEVSIGTKNKLHKLTTTQQNKNLSQNEYDIAVNKMLQMGWSSKEIADLPYDDIIDYAEAISYSKNSQFLRYYIDDNNIEQVTSISENLFDFETNFEKSKTNKVNKIAGMSSDGKLEISPIWNSSSETNVYNSTGYLKQDQYLTWLGNNTYFTSYRWEWVIQTENTKKDVFYICNQMDLTPIEGTESYVYKYDFTRDNDSVIVRTYENFTPTATKKTSDGIAYTVDLKDMEAVTSSDNYCYTRFTNSRGYMSYKMKVSSSSTGTSVSGGYYHCKSPVVINPSVTFNGLTISVSPSSFYVEESPGTSVSVVK